MAVNVGQRNVPDTPANRQLEACQKAMDLALHTIKICNNKNIFKVEYQEALTNDIIKCAKDIYVFSWNGNNIYVTKNNGRWEQREKLQRLVSLAKRGEITKAKVDECYKSWKANASKGNSYKLIQRMDEYYNNLWREVANEN